MKVKFTSSIGLFSSPNMFPKFPWVCFLFVINISFHNTSGAEQLVILSFFLTTIILAFVFLVCQYSYLSPRKLYLQWASSRKFNIEKKTSRGGAPSSIASEHVTPRYCSITLSGHMVKFYLPLFVFNHLCDPTAGFNLHWYQPDTFVSMMSKWLKKIKVILKSLIIYYSTHW